MNIKNVIPSNTIRDRSPTRVRVRLIYHSIPRVLSAVKLKFGDNLPIPRLGDPIDFFHGPIRHMSILTFLYYIHNKIMLITTPKVVTFLLIKYKVLSLELNLVLKKQISLTKFLNFLL